MQAKRLAEKLAKQVMDGSTALPEFQEALRQHHAYQARRGKEDS